MAASVPLFLYNKRRYAKGMQAAFDAVNGVEVNRIPFMTQVITAQYRGRR